MTEKQQPSVHSLTISVGGKTITLETGKIASLASGSVTLQCGETILLSTACMGKFLPDVDFMPLRVDYTEKFSSAGKTLGGFIKREGKPTERETLMCRLTDRPIRPMFEEGYRHDTQVMTQVYSYDGVNTPEPLAICAASAALVISEIPFIKPIAAVRVGMINGKFIINPTNEEQQKSILDLMLAGTEDAILMIEGYCDFLTEEQIMAAIEEGHQTIKEICVKLAEWAKVVGKEKKRDTLKPLPQEAVAAAEKLMKEELAIILTIHEKKPRDEQLSLLKEKVQENLFPADADSNTNSFTAIELNQAMKKVISSQMREMVLNTNTRVDGRSPKEIRPIYVELGLLPRTHGSALFTRGETQSLAVCTLGSESMGQRYETLDEDNIRRFYLQYTFPPFSVGEVGRSGPPGRREVGHGKLAERALMASKPSIEEFPYTIRIESNITACNGSSSMASVCGGCLALMEAGVPIKRPIAGIAMGLILEGDKHVILSDIIGFEDFLGDMDFKITGDEKGITAFQLDIKVEGITQAIMKEALEQAKDGLTHILNKMLQALPASKPQLSKYAPRIEVLKVKPNQIGTIIGPGGKQIRAIVDETGVDINIDDDGQVHLASNNPEAMQRAKAIIHDLTADVEIGQSYKGKIVTIKDFGLFVAILSKQGLCHISEISHSRIDNLHDLYKEGDMIDVKVLDVNQSGQIRLSHKALLVEKEG
ncbi:polyribonucleotide nucleotidyltransferase [Candidatus Aerophobetes bacterium]|uniref:Polyribonucleotide nucleotidyltransferase n=1 Tax=Aerophobetes bacterium TaxID=2030807 RepID=A0A2A4X1E3_UNCAE|nr:MAG: polyribonucleotide nucleotidyltransferase [Candidatus Aerophobetes bacterium]